MSVVPRVGSARIGLVIYGFGWKTGVGAAQRALVSGIRRVAPHQKMVFFGKRQDLEQMPGSAEWDKIEVSSLDELRDAVDHVGPALLHLPMCLPIDRMPCKAVVSVHDTMMLRNVDSRPAWVAEFDERSVRRAVNASDHVITVSQYSSCA